MHLTLMSQATIQPTQLIRAGVRLLPESLEVVAHRVLWSEHYRELRRIRESLEPRLGAGATAIFIHTPRCAGSSMFRAFPNVLNYSHLTINDYRILFGRELYDRLYKFGFVRNPWDRLVSAYFHMKRGGNHGQDKGWADKHLSRYENFEAFVTGWLTPRHVLTGAWHFVPMTRFVCLPGHGRASLDYLGRYETLERDFAVVCREQGLVTSLGHMNAAPRELRDYREYYTPKTRAIVAKVYAGDIRAFDYAF